MNFYYTIRIINAFNMFLSSISLKMMLNCFTLHIINRITESVLNQIILVFVVSSSIEFETYHSQTIIWLYHNLAKTTLLSSKSIRKYPIQVFMPYCTGNSNPCWNFKDHLFYFHPFDAGFMIYHSYGDTNQPACIIEIYV